MHYILTLTTSEESDNSDKLMPSTYCWQ